MDALARQGSVRYVLGLTEAAVIGMADGYAQQSGQMSAANVHVQPGLANALSGILNAARARVPMLVTVGQQVRSMLPGAPFLGGELVAMAAPLAKGAWEAERAEDLPALLARAVRVARTPPCGPVVLSIPMDLQVAPAPAFHSPSPGEAPPAPDPEALTRAAALLGAARAPVVLVGDGVVHAQAGGAAAAVAERLGAPILGEPFAARAPLPTDHPLWRGPLPGFASEIHAALAGHDVALAVGMPVFRLFGVSEGPALPGGVSLVHLDVDPEEVGRTYPPAVGMVAHPGLALEGLLRSLGPPDDAARARRARSAAEAAAIRRGRRAALARGGDGAISPQAFCRAVAAIAAPRDLVVDEALTSGRLLRSALSGRRPGTWLAHRGSALGWGLPAAVGAALADPARRVIALHGDGSFVFGAPALWTAAREGVPMALVIADNGGYEILRAGLEGLTGRAHGGWPGLAIDGPALDLVALARGFGADAAGVAEPADLREAMADLMSRATGGPAVLVVRVSGRTPPVGYPL